VCATSQMSSSSATMYSNAYNSVVLYYFTFHQFICNPLYDNSHNLNLTLYHSMPYLPCCVYRYFLGPSSESPPHSICLIMSDNFSFIHKLLCAYNPKYASTWNTVLVMLRKTDGWDKSLKCTIYSIRLMIWMARASDVVGNTPQPVSSMLLEWFKFTKFLSKKVGNSRKVIRLLRWTYDLPDIRESLQDLTEMYNDPDSRMMSLDGAVACTQVFNSSCSFVTDVCDDVAWMCSIGLLPSSMIDTADAIGDPAWFVTCVLDLSFALQDLYCSRRNWQRIQQKQSRGDDSLQHTSEAALEDMETDMLTVFKYIGDLGVSSTTMLEWDSFRAQGFVLVSGLLSGVCSTLKLLRKARKVYEKELSKQQQLQQQLQLQQQSVRTVSE
jgi:Peroxisomal biogenesis factor 11 (PEX11)